MTRKKKNRGNFTRVLGYLLIVLAAVLLLVDPYKNYLIKKGTEENRIVHLTRDDIARNENADVSFDFDNVHTLNATDVLMDQANPADLPTVGAVAIPSVKMNIPIYKGVSNEGMYLGAGTLLPDQQMGISNYPIASHHSIHKDLLFAPLPNVQLGDSIFLTDLDQIYEYRVVMNQEVSADRIDLIEPTPTPIVTLITCDASLVNRIVVQGELVDQTPITKATQEMLDAFEMTQTVPD